MTTRVLRVAAVGPPILVSATMWLIAVALIPAPVAAAMCVVMLAVVVVAALRVGEGAVVRVVWGGRQLRPTELDDLRAALTVLCRAGLGSPLVDLRLRRDRRIDAVGVGRRTVLLSTGLLAAVAEQRWTPEQAAALLGHAAVVVRSHLVARDPLLAVVTLPWTMLAALVGLVSRPIRRLPGLGTIWRGRWLVVAVAVVQQVRDAPLVLAAGTALIGAVSYGLPLAQTRWRQLLTGVGDEGVAAAGLGAALASVLMRSGAPPARRARLRALSVAPPTRPRLGLVSR